MTQGAFWALVGVALVVVGLYALIVHAHLLRKVLALNVISSGVFLVFVGLSRYAPAAAPGPYADPVPQAMVLTGIVVAVAATGLALALIVRLRTLSGRAVLADGRETAPGEGSEGSGEEGVGANETRGSLGGDGEGGGTAARRYPSPGTGR